MDGREAGDEIRTAAPTTVRVHAKAKSQVPMQRLEIVVNGRVVHTDQAAASEVQTDVEIPVKKSSWIAARVIGGPHRLVPNDIAVFAHSGPVFCYVGGRPIASPEAAKFLMGWIDQLIARTNSKGRFASQEHRDQVLAAFRKGREYYRRIAEDTAN